MKAEDLLLTDEEHAAAWNRGVESGRVDWLYAGAEAVKRAQAAKVLAVLERHFRGHIADPRGFICGVIRDTGLTWPPQEECGVRDCFHREPHTHVSIPPKEG